MFHMLGRFAFISSLSRRSSSGLSKGSNGFGFCFCETDPLSIFIISYQSIHYSQFASRYAGCSLAQTQRPTRAMFLQHLIWGLSLPDHMLSDRGDICCLDGASLPWGRLRPVENPIFLFFNIPIAV